MRLRKRLNAYVPFTKCWINNQGIETFEGTYILWGDK